MVIVWSINNSRQILVLLGTSLRVMSRLKHIRDMAIVFSLLFYCRFITEPLSYISGRIIQVGKMKLPRWPKAVTERSCRLAGISTTSAMGAIIKITTRAILSNSMVSSMLNVLFIICLEKLFIYEHCGNEQCIFKIVRFCAHSSCLCAVKLKQTSPTNQCYWCRGESSIMKDSPGEFNCSFFYWKTFNE